ncbi:TetR/AcrR family transcriptional regulator [Gallaecimonas xiamenensis]|uniref:TetR family transcriptional regulator n=1 Tax=Gallaecimonas xiamenensis 3-C-1 TaxID=745411 RepID=K2JGQ7_9GAMM|nr:TetR/AcrR family transcriptional regulator [Gallaecimonas xiamenensis]EKE73742.1 TetR family transcriptional regulator [Gallaecimonas xiamenensis 3-C-1]
MSKTRLTDLKRDAIIQAAIGEFRERGYEATSMDKVAARAEVSKRTVYNHFASKEGLFAECLDTLWQSCDPGLDQGYKADSPLRDQLAALLAAKVTMLRDPSFLDLAKVAVAEAIHSPERAQVIVQRIGKREQGLNHWLAAALADGRLKPLDPDMAAQQLHGLLKTFAFWPQLTMGAPLLSDGEAKAVIESALDMFLACYQA